MRGSIKYKIFLFLLSLSVFSFACGGAYYLGRLYIGIIKNGYSPKSVRVDSGKVKSVVAQDEQKLLMLNPVPVFFLQAGVYSDQAGAKKAAAVLDSLGYKPYITKTAPFKLWIGIYKDRAYAENTKAKLLEKGISTFTGSIVVNGNNLKYSEANEALIQGISPALEQYTVWLKENLTLFGSSDVATLDSKIIDSEITVIDKVYNGFNKQKALRFNNQMLNDGFNELAGNVTDYKERLHIFQKQKNSENYIILQRKLLEFVDNYMLIMQKIENISKT